MPDTLRPSFHQVIVGGFRTASISRANLAKVMVADCLAARNDPEWLPKLVYSSNGQGIALAGKNDEFAQVMNEADIVHADGMSVVFASKLTRHPLPERIATTDFFHDAAEVATKHNLSFYILGSTRAQNDAAVAKIKQIYPAVRIVGQHDGYFSASDNDRICAEIRAAKPDVLWVALGKPRQELWCLANREKLRGIGWIKTCGGLYAFLAGDVPRAPVWMQNAGLEWLFRTFDDPKRLIWRYLATNPYAFFRLLTKTQRRAEG